MRKDPDALGFLEVLYGEAGLPLQAYAWAGMLVLVFLIAVSAMVAL